MNAEWHARHVMPKNAATEERIAWHREHQKHCGCRPIPAKLAATMRAMGVRLSQMEKRRKQGPSR